MEEVIQSFKPEESLYTLLQEESLEYVQGMSGKIWTDYNIHDPGVTILDLLNYVLWDLDYQLSFNLEDYLTPENKHFVPKVNGLFSPLEVFPVSPVTPDDYRKLIFDSFDDIENVEVIPFEPTDVKTCRGMYDLKIQICFWSDNKIREKYLKQKIQSLFHQNRNLCESLHEIYFVNWNTLTITGTIEIEAEVDPSLILSRIYTEAADMFTGGIRYRNLQSLLQNGTSLDEILEGPRLHYLTVDDDSLTDSIQISVYSQLYNCIKEIAGVKSIRSLDLPELDGAGIMNNIAVRFPKKKAEVLIRLVCAGQEISFNFEKVSRQLYLYKMNLYGDQHRTSNLDFYKSPAGSFRDIYTLYSVQNEFPHCYGINKWGVAPDKSDLRKAQARQLKAYMLIFDLLVAKGLNEVENIRQWMQLTSELPTDRIPVLSNDPLLKWEGLTDDIKREETEKGRSHTLKYEKRKWLDVIDKIYGEQSNPTFLDNLNIYEDTEEEITARRTKFLSLVPEWGYGRFKGINIYDTTNSGRSGLDLYITTLLGFAGANGHPIANLLPCYNLSMLGDSAFFSKLGWLLDYRLVTQNRKDILEEKRLCDVPLRKREWTDDKYEWLRLQFPLLQHGFIFESFLQKGFQIDNYKILTLPLNDSGSVFYLLLFRYGIGKNWSSLGRFSSKEEAIHAANCLCSFLLMLNRRSETMYVVEHLLLAPINQETELEESEEEEEEYDEGESNDQAVFSKKQQLLLDFSMTIVLNGTTARTANPLFRKQTEQLILEKAPVHLDIGIYWLSFWDMTVFEKLYYSWRDALTSSIAGEVNKKSGELAAFLLKIKEKYDRDR